MLWRIKIIEILVTIEWSRYFWLLCKDCA